MCAPPHEPTGTFEDSAEFVGALLGQAAGDWAARRSVSKAFESLSGSPNIGGNSAPVSITKIIAHNIAHMSSNSGLMQSLLACGVHCQLFGRASWHSPAFARTASKTTTAVQLKRASVIVPFSAIFPGHAAFT